MSKKESYMMFDTVHSNYFSPSEKLKKIPFLFDKLDELTVDGHLRSECNLWCTFDDQNFLKNHSSIQKLTIKNLIVKNWPNPILLPSLKKFVFIPRMKPCTINKALDYLRQFKSLKSFSSECCDSEDTVRNYCANTWQVHRILYENKLIYRLKCITT